ncbi:MAG: TetR/AcrR family transcriptional regulator [Rhizobiaceae bacterium]
MARTKRLPDEAVLDAALELIHRRGPDSLTFANLSEVCGLSPATLVQRFHGKPELVQAALLRAWDRLDEKTARLASELPKTPDGAVRMLVGLSGSYGGIEEYAEGLLVLREDFRDPVLRARGAAWKAALSAALDACFADVALAPEGIGLLMASQWQGSLLWWAFEPDERLDIHVEKSLRSFVRALGASRT